MSDPGIPNFSQVMEGTVAAAGEAIRCCQPGVITAVSSGNKTVDVQPAIRRQGMSEYDPVIPDVPLVFPRCGKSRMTFDVSKDDAVLLFFSDRCLDEWIAGGGSKKAPTKDARTHNITDAFAVPMDVASSVTTGALELDHDVLIKLGAAATQSLLKGTLVNTALGAFLASMAAAKTVWDAADPQQLADVKTFINSLNTALATLQTSHGGTFWLSELVKTE